MGLLSWLPGGSGKARRLLADYADDRLPHVAAPGELSRAQRDGNLAAFVASLDRRIDRLTAFAAALDTVLPMPDGNRAGVDAAARALDAFCKAKLSGLAEIEPALAMDWQGREAQEIERQVHTLATDMGAWCGETALACAPQYAWATDDAHYTTAKMMATAGRVVIGHDPAAIPRPIRSPVDPIAIAAFGLSQVVHFRTVKAKALWRPNYFHFMGELADGRYC